MAKYSDINSAIKKFDKNEVPVLIPTFNNPTYLKNMINQLKKYNLSNKTVVYDNASCYPKMIDFLNDISDEIDVVFLNKNLGPREPLQNIDIFSSFTNYFIITDPDIFINEKMPNTFIEDLKYILNKHNVSKAGLSIDISNKDIFFDYQYVLSEERLNYANIIDEYKGNKIYKSRYVDTTFALYSKENYFNEFFLSNKEKKDNCSTSSIRIAGDYSCQHPSWWKTPPIPKEELEYYAKTHQWSTTEREKKRINFTHQ